MLQPLVNAFAVKERIRIHAGKCIVTTLPQKDRQVILDRLRTVAKRHGIAVRLCMCKNPDITAGSCYISGRWMEAEGGSRQLNFDLGDA
jgi:hypothetical protein